MLVWNAPLPAQSDVAALAAEARRALGGDAALDAITSLVITGSEVKRLGPVSPSSSIEISYQLPDKFMRLSRRVTDGPFTFTITEYEGFSGDEPLNRTVSPDAPFPVAIPAGPPPSTASEIAAARARSLAAPVVMGTTTRTFSTTEVVRAGPGGGPPVNRPVSPPPLPSAPPIAGDPTGGLADVQWTMTIGDYKTADGLTWPRRFKTYFGGKEWEDFRVSRYRLNQKIDSRVFEIKK